MAEVTCVPADLMSEARLIDCCVPQNMQTAVLISLFCQMAEVSCDSADLLENAKCIQTCIPEGMQGAVLIYLACQIVNNGGGGSGGGGNVFCGHYGGVMPTTPVLAADACGINYDLDSPFDTWKWSGTDWSG